MHMVYALCLYGSIARRNNSCLGGQSVMMLAIGIVTAILWGVLIRNIVKSLRCLRRLSDISPLAPQDPHPRVSIVIPARNEEEHIDNTIQRVLSLDYPNLECIVVDDRSVDQTGLRLDEWARKDSRLKVQHLTTSDPDWIGVNYALYRGASVATGEWLLFLDADVFLSAQALSKGLHYAMTQNLDHVTVFRATAFYGTNRIVRAFVLYLLFQYYAFGSPWKVRDPQSPVYMGDSAFNLIRRAAYEAFGGHQAIRGFLDDDYKLGLCVKSQGFRQDVLVSGGEVAVPWYASLGAMVEGLGRVLLGTLEYNLNRQMIVAPIMLTFWLWPFIGVMFSHGLTQFLYLALSVVCLGTFFGLTVSQDIYNPFYIIVFPVLPILWAYMMERSAIVARRHGGVRWRSQYYSLEFLRQYLVMHRSSLK